MDDAAVRLGDAAAGLADAAAVASTAGPAFSFGLVAAGSPAASPFATAGAAGLGRLVKKLAMLGCPAGLAAGFGVFILTGCLSPDTRKSCSGRADGPFHAATTPLRSGNVQGSTLR